MKFKKNNLIINGQSWRQTWFKYLFFIMDNLKIRSTFSQHLYTVYIRQPNAKVMPWKDKKREHFQTNIPIFLTPSNALNDALINPVQENSWNYSLSEENFCQIKKNEMLFCFAFHSSLLSQFMTFFKTYNIFTKL